jgi:hypothetical protein
MDHLQPFTFGSPRHTHSGQCFLVLIHLILGGDSTETRILLAFFLVSLLPLFEAIFTSILSDIGVCFLFVYGLLSVSSVRVAPKRTSIVKSLD